MARVPDALSIVPLMVFHVNEGISSSQNTVDLVEQQQAAIQFKQKQYNSGKTYQSEILNQNS